MPATRKLCGFLGHAARIGCNKCLKAFPTTAFGDKPDFSEYNRNEWELRTSTHRTHSLELLTATSKSALETLEGRYGISYSVLINLPLFDPIRFVAVDPMVVSLWITRNILTPQDLHTIQEKAKLFISICYWQNPY